VRVETGGLAQFFDRQIDLVGDDEIEAEDVMGRLARTPPIDPLAVAELVALPGLADREAGKERDQRGKQRIVVAHLLVTAFASLRNAATSGSHLPCARRISSTSSRAAPHPPPNRLTQWTRARTSWTASAGAADKPARPSTGRSSTSSPMYATSASLSPCCRRISS